MAFFRGKKQHRDFPRTGHPMDDQLMQLMANEGFDFDARREFTHYVYCDSEIGASQLETAAIEAGWSVTRVAFGIGIVATRTDLPVNRQTVTGARSFFEGLASRVAGGDYDGWEASA